MADLFTVPDDPLVGSYKSSYEKWIKARDKIVTQNGFISSSETEANTKTRTFFQDDQPTSGVNENDIWIDPNNNFNMYVYSSSSWVQIN